MSTFSGLNAAYTGLVAARHGLDVTGQNIANANTAGYTRQRIETSASEAPRLGLFSTGIRPGQGVLVTGIARLGEAHLDTRVRISAGTAGYTEVRAEAFSTFETSLREPGADGISTSLQQFWAGWQDLSNQADQDAPAIHLLAKADDLAQRIATGYRAVEDQWSTLRSSATGVVAEVNATAGQIAQLNDQVRITLAAGGSANELIDRRAALATTVATLAGGVVRDNPDGTIAVLIGGSAVVDGGAARELKLSGSASLAEGGVVQVEWAHRPGAPAALESGELAGALSLLAPADGGGVLTQAAAGYDTFARDLATQVNRIHGGDGAKGDFFAFDPSRPALSLAVMPADRSGIAIGDPAAGAYDGSVADRISELGLDGAGSPDVQWANFVTGIGSATRSELQGNALAALSASSAVQQQLSSSSVSMDEEQVNLLTYQHAYQGAARVMTAVDEMLDVLINRTGIVGR
ncbi:flagellar hook-associated protein FlgK [Arthrobacter sp. H41]|uniref:flagellar hook-associated protein FlgK n=1 Tax=Arthrobacter sp. H41 TaxID=1312978 RepID=UPI0004788DA7|nr:flagellar hook-associated protein FlgK [Arthrobacter sp. H41]